MADQDKIGWQVGARFYPHVGADALRHGDFALIREVTGMTLDQFDRGDDPIATETGWLAVAVWQANPDLRREQVVRMIEQMTPDESVRVGWEIPKEADAGPPAQAGAATEQGSPSQEPHSGSSSKTSAASPEETNQETSTPDSSGALA